MAQKRGSKQWVGQMYNGAIGAYEPVEIFLTEGPPLTVKDKDGIVVLTLSAN